MLSLTLACLTFVGTHLLLSHPLRGALVARVGERGFQGIYSLAAIVSFAWMVLAYRAIPPQPPYWVLGDVGWAVALLVMWAASVLFVGSLIRNPALPDPAAQRNATMPPRGVYAVTRHPMMFAIILWAAVHIAVVPTAAGILLAETILFLALVGSIGQDVKKRRLMGTDWQGWQGRTAFVPFMQQLDGRLSWRDALPSAGVLIAGTLLWLAATGAHGGIGAGIWRWL
jgi:uncharacterized membrane protein